MPEVSWPAKLAFSALACEIILPFAPVKVKFMRTLTWFTLITALRLSCEVINPRRMY